jgi:hypothetical protein
MSKVIYLAAPYTDPDPKVVQSRMHEVHLALARYASEGHAIFTPLLMHHCLNVGIDLPSDFSFWERYCMAFLAKSDYLLVLCLPGWETSKGVQREIEEAKKLKIPIIHTNQ